MTTLATNIILLGFVMVSAFFVASFTEAYIYVPTYFAKRDNEGNYVNANNKDAWFTIHATTPASTSTLKVIPSIVGDGKDVTVTWSGVDLPSKLDIIAFYCPETATDQDYLDYFNADVSRSCEDGNGQHTVKLFNLRTHCEFRYFRNISTDHQEHVATSNILVFEGGPEKPLQIHLALTGDPTQMRVMWVTGAIDQTPIVEYGRNGELTAKAEGESKTYNETDLCSMNARMFNDPGFIHDVLLTDLKPSTIYNYSCGVSGHMSDVRSFKTAPPIGSSVSYKFIAYGDMGVDSECIKTAKYSFKDVKDGYEFVLHIGDLSYALGFGYIWDQWHSLIQPYASIVPYMVGIGNHEQNHISTSTKDLSVPNGKAYRPWWGNYYDDGNGECGIPPFYRFHMPDNGNYLWWYSYDYGMVHFTMMSTEHDMGKGSPQYTWLENDLRNVDRSKTPWIIVGGHRPMYTSQLDPRNYLVSLGMEILFEDLLHENKVDLALWGHYHSYERTCAVYQGVCVDSGTVHIIIGTAGRGEDWPPFIYTSWSRYQRHEDSYGYGRVTVANRSALHWEYFVYSEQRVVDDVWLFKN